MWCTVTSIVFKSSVYVLLNSAKYVTNLLILHLKQSSGQKPCSLEMITYTSKVQNF